MCLIDGWQWWHWLDDWRCFSRDGSSILWWLALDSEHVWNILEIFCCSPLTDQILAEDGADLELTVMSGADIVLRCPALVIVRWWLTTNDWFHREIVLWESCEVKLWGRKVGNWWELMVLAFSFFLCLDLFKSQRLLNTVTWQLHGQNNIIFLLINF